MDNNLNKSTNKNNLLIIIGAQRSGKTIMAKEMMRCFFINEVVYLFASPLHLDQGILPKELLAGSPKKIIVVEGVTNLFHVLAIIIYVKARYKNLGAPLPKMVFTCQDETRIDMDSLHIENISVMRLDNRGLRR